VIKRLFSLSSYNLTFQLIILNLIIVFLGLVFLSYFNFNLIQNNKFNNTKFDDLSNFEKEYMSISSINDDKVFEINSVKMLYSLPVNSFTLVNNSENKIYLVKITGYNKNLLNKEGEDYKNFVNSEFTNTRKSILAAYDQLLTSKYKIQLNQKTIDRVKNYFK